MYDIIFLALLMLNQKIDQLTGTQPRCRYQKIDQASLIARALALCHCVRMSTIQKIYQVSSHAPLLSKRSIKHTLPRTLSPHAYNGSSELPRGLAVPKDQSSRMHPLTLLPHRDIPIRSLISARVYCVLCAHTETRTPAFCHEEDNYNEEAIATEYVGVC